MTAHPPPVPPDDYENHLGNSRQYMRDIILGVNDGLVSTFLLVAGVVGGGLSATQVLLTGVAGALAGMISMGVGEYLATKSQEEVFEAEMKLEAKHLEEHVREVRLSSRLTSSPACLVGSEHDMSPHLERLLRGGPMEIPRQKRILELNPEHAIVIALNQHHDTDSEDPRIAKTAELLLGYALLGEGSELPDPARFNALLAELMAGSL